MPVIRRLTLLLSLIIAAGLLVGCVPLPPYDPVLAQKGVYEQQRTEALPQPAAAASTSAAGIEPTAVAEMPTAVEPTSVPAPLALVSPTAAAAAPVVRAAPTMTPAQPAQVETASPPVTTTIAPTIATEGQALAAPAPTGTPEPTRTPTARATATPAPTRTPRPTNTIPVPATRVALPTRAPAPTATADQHLIVITEDDIARAVSGGAAAQQGVTLENLKVRFSDGKTRITADKLGYGIIKMQNLDLVGRLAAQNGVLSLAVESISPRGLAANFLPGAVNQALANYASQWYVEDVRTLDGRVELRVR